METLKPYFQSRWKLANVAVTHNYEAKLRKRDIVLDLIKVTLLTAAGACLKTAYPRATILLSEAVIVGGTVHLRNRVCNHDSIAPYRAADIVRITSAVGAFLFGVGLGSLYINARFIQAAFRARNIYQCLAGVNGIAFAGWLTLPLSLAILKTSHYMLNGYYVKVNAGAGYWSKTVSDIMDNECFSGASRVEQAYHHFGRLNFHVEDYWKYVKDELDLDSLNQRQGWSAAMGWWRYKPLLDSEKYQERLEKLFEPIVKDLDASTARKLLKEVPNLGVVWMLNHCPQLKEEIDDDLHINTQITKKEFKERLSRHLGYSSGFLAAVVKMGWVAFSLANMALAAKNAPRTFAAISGVVLLFSLFPKSKMLLAKTPSHERPSAKLHKFALAPPVIKAQEVWLSTLLKFGTFYFPQLTVVDAAIEGTLLAEKSVRVLNEAILRYRGV